LQELQFSRQLGQHHAELRRAVGDAVDGLAPEQAEEVLFARIGERTPTEVRPSEEVLRIFHLDDVPAPVVEADLAASGQRVGAVTCVPMVQQAFAEDAAKIDVPVFLGFGERDISPDPWQEPAGYRSSPDVTLHMLAGSAHCHNYAATRMRQWDRIAAWLGETAAPDAA
jgi:pimeloyl-ACP methyl ester carboxylesterase